VSLLKALVTGGAGFIGSNLVGRLVNKGFKVKIIDNLTSGKLSNIKKYINEGSAEFIYCDLKYVKPKELAQYFVDVDVVYHLAANPEVRVSVTEPEIHFKENVVATFNVLEACRLASVPLLVFTSSSTVYGDAKVFPTPEDYTPLEPISVYGASKLASENMIITYSMLYGIKAVILRLANIVGPNQTHGVIVDFINKLRRNPQELEILGDGTQKKSYLHINDLLKAFDIVVEFMEGKSRKSYDIFNVGNEDWITVREIADIVVEEMGLRNVKYIFKPGTKDGRGWIGDVKFMLLDIRKLKSIGWKPELSSSDAIRLTVRSLLGINDG